jgi:uncharacterized repeat protein (TIGR01451 family)
MRTGKLLCAPLVLAVTCASLALSAAPASALEPGPGWELTTERFPTNLPPGGTGKIVVGVFNVGEARSTGTVTVTDTLPEGLIATAAGEQSSNLGFEPGSSYWDCSGIGTSVVTCVNDPTNMPHLAGGAGGSNPALQGGPNIDPAIGIDVAVNASPGTEINRATIAGGGAPASASTEGPVTISSTPAAGGITNWDVWFSNADGTLDTQAGSHPYEASFSVNFASEIAKVVLIGPYGPTGGEVRNIETRLPAGFIGNPTVVPEPPATRGTLSWSQSDRAAAGVCRWWCPVSVAGVQHGSPLRGSGRVRRLYRRHGHAVRRQRAQWQRLRDH